MPTVFLEEIQSLVAEQERTVLQIENPILITGNVVILFVYITTHRTKIDRYITAHAF